MQNTILGHFGIRRFLGTIKTDIKMVIKEPYVVVLYGGT